MRSSRSRARNMFAKAYETVVASLITSSENLYKMAAKQEYHISRSELLGWLNNLLGLSYTKVEQCASGNPQHNPTSDCSISS